MSSGVSWYPNTQEIVPWNATYQFPSASNKTQASNPRITPTSGSVFAPTQTTRIEMPPVGHMNPANSFLTFDVTVFADAVGSCRFQNNISSIIRRLRWTYGSGVLEDIDRYGDLVRFVSEHTSTNTNGSVDQTTFEGSGGYTMGADNAGFLGNVNVREKYIHGKVANDNGGVNQPGAPGNFAGGSGWGLVPGAQSNPINAQNPNGGIPITRRYTIPLLSGLMIQRKLIPLKYMASNFALEITWADAKDCMFVPVASGSDPSYAVGNVAFLPELLEFSPSYDNDMEKNGLLNNGVPINYATFQTHVSSSANSSDVSINIPARSRSIKAIFALQKRAISSFTTDSGASFYDTSANGASTLQSFQLQAGGKYWPARPHECSSAGNIFSNGGSEAFAALQVAFSTHGDYKYSTTTSAKNWDIAPTVGGKLCEFDYNDEILSYDSQNRPVYGTVRTLTNSFCGTLPSASFGMGFNLETSNGPELSGLNGLEQNNITLLAKWSAPQVTGASNTPSQILIFVYHDATLVIEAFNGMKVIT